MNCEPRHNCRLVCASSLTPFFQQHRGFSRGRPLDGWVRQNAWVMSKHEAQASSQVRRRRKAVQDASNDLQGGHEEASTGSGGGQKKK